MNLANIICIICIVLMLGAKVLSDLIDIWNEINRKEKQNEKQNDRFKQSFIRGIRKIE